MAPPQAENHALVPLTLALQVKSELLGWLDDLQRHLGLRSRDAVVSRLLESLAAGNDDG